MQYASIIVDHKAGFEPLTYAIPPTLLPYLTTGSVVIIPVGRVVCHGVVVKFMKQVEARLVGKLKPIQSLVYESLVSPQVIAATHQLHSRYGNGLNDLLFYLLPPFPKRRQPLPAPATLSPHHNFAVKEYVADTLQRPLIYQRLANTLSPQGLSLLIICASARAATGLAQALAHLNPKLVPTGNEKTEREHYIASLNIATPSLFIGTRSALKTSLRHIGAVAMDEPWLPAQKEDNAPKLWTSLIAQELCRTHGIPLYLLSSLPWPETRHLERAKRYLAAPDATGEVHIVPKRPLAELLTQFFADCEEDRANCAITIRESNREVLWCSQCKKTTGQLTCSTCRQPVVILPKMNKEAIQQELAQTNEPPVEIFSSDELLQFRSFRSLLVLNFDVFLSIVDFRATLYLCTLLATLRSQSQSTYLVTSHPDTWVSLLQKDRHFFTTTELLERKQHLLPPYSLAVQFKATKKDDLEALKPSLDPLALKIGPIRTQHGEYQLSVLLRLNSTLPPAWFRSSKVKVDILPNYID